MNIPDQLFYASLAAQGTFLVWVARQFVLSVWKPKQEPQHRQEQQHPVLTVRAYREIANMLKEELDGRYMCADEARDHFSDLQRAIDSVALKLQVYMAENGTSRGSNS